MTANLLVIFASLYYRASTYLHLVSHVYEPEIRIVK